MTGASTPSANVSVIIPTIGRPRQLQAALTSLMACRPRATEVVVVDQSNGDEVADVISAFAVQGVRRVHCAARGIGLAMNRGVAEARCPVVMITNDDCTVAPGWIEVAQRELAGSPGAIVTGSVLPAGDASAVPSTRVQSSPTDYTGTLASNALYAANMAVLRESLLAFGGFDERMSPSAEDNDLCYRWLAAGRTLRYVPEMRIWHHDWRSREELRELYRRYGFGQGMFYAKHLRGADLRVLRLLGQEVQWLARDIVRAALRARRPADEVAMHLLGLAPGFRQGLRTFADAPRSGR